jgi:hypothetical protein
MNQPMILDFRSPDGREAVRKAMRLLSARIGLERGHTGGQRIYSEVLEELGLPYDYDTLMIVAAQVEITHMIMLWASMEEQLDAIPLTEFAKDPQSVMAFIEQFFEERVLGPDWAPDES